MSTDVAAGPVDEPNVPPADSAQPGPSPDRWKALSVCLIAGFMTLLDVSIVNVALPSIETGVGASSSALQWIVAGYALALGLILVPAGRLGDARSRRVVFSVGLAAFTLFSVLAGAATGPLWLSLARIAQGLGAGIVIPQIAGFIQGLFAGPERGKAYGLFGATVGISTAVGPLLGGVLIKVAGVEQGWRWVFLVNLPIGVLALLMARRYLPAGVSTGRRESLDPVGVGLLASGTFLILLPLVSGDQSSLSKRPWWLEGIAAVLLISFVLWERRVGATGGAPVIDLDLFKLRSFALGTSLGTLYFAGFTSVFLVLTLYLQNGLHYSALLAGVTTVPFALGSAGAAALGGRIVHRYGRIIVVIGLALVAIGLIGVDVIVGRSEQHVGWLIAIPLLIAGIGSGGVIAPNQTITLSEVSAAGGGSGAGVVQTGQRVGSAIGVAVVTAVFFSTVAQQKGDFTAGLSIGLRVAVGFVLLALIIGASDLLPARRSRTATALRHQ